MEPADGAVSGAVTIRRNHWRGALFGVGVAMAAGLFVLLAPAPAHADDGGSGSSGLLGGVVSDLTGVVDSIVSPVVEPLPSLRDVPVVGGIVGDVVDSKPVGTVVAPVSGLVDGLLGDTVGSLPIVGGILGDRPIGDITDPVAGTVDSTLGDLVAGPGIVLPPVLFPQTDAAAIQPDAATAAASGLTAALLPVLARAADLGAIVAGAGNSPIGGFASVPGDSMPTSAVTASGPPGGLAAAVLGAGLLLFFFAGRLRPELFRAPPSPTFDTDSSPD